MRREGREEGVARRREIAAREQLVRVGERRRRCRGRRRQDRLCRRGRRRLRGELTLGSRAHGRNVRVLQTFEQRRRLVGPVVGDQRIGVVEREAVVGRIALEHERAFSDRRGVSLGAHVRIEGRLLALHHGALRRPALRGYRLEAREDRRQRRDGRNPERNEGSHYTFRREAKNTMTSNSRKNSPITSGAVRLTSFRCSRTRASVSV